MLEFAGVSRTYLDGQPVHALRPTDLAIEQGSYVTITGPSGAGKSTLLNLLGLLDTPTAGCYLINGVEVTGLREATLGAARAQLFGFVFQMFHLLSGRTALENVELGMLYGPRSRRQRRVRAAAALSRVGLMHRAYADPRTLSGGERQRVAIARALSGRPRVLLCDEPTGNLDSASTANVLELLHELHTEGLTLIVVTHEAEVARQGTHKLAVADGVVSQS